MGNTKSKYLTEFSSMDKTAVTGVKEWGTKRVSVKTERAPTTPTMQGFVRDHTDGACAYSRLAPDINHESRHNIRNMDAIDLKSADVVVMGEHRLIFRELIADSNWIMEH